MQTLSIQVEDSHPNITVIKDKNLEYDADFYERKKDLEQIIEDSENGTMEMLSQEQYDQEMKIFKTRLYKTLFFPKIDKNKR